MAYRLAELAVRVGGRVEGEADRLVEGIRALDSAGPRDLSLLTHSRRSQAEASAAGAFLVAPETVLAGRDLLVVEEPSLAFARLLALFHPVKPRAPGVHPTAVIEDGAVLDPEAHVGPYAVIGANSRIDARAAVLAHVVVGRGCSVGEGAVLHPHVVLYDGTEVGAGSEIHAGAILGSDGFGYATVAGVHHKVPQIGRVVLEEGVEIGANTTIDRATLDETRIGAGSKVDNLVQVGHNVRLGRACVLCGQAGIAGSTRLGDFVVMAGQAGAGGHLELGDRVQVAAKSAALTSVAAGTTVAGIPAVEMGRWRRQVVMQSQLGEMKRRLAELTRRLEKVEKVETVERSGGERPGGRDEQ